ncbi:MAG: hypothetical protein JXN59_14335 [Anaerolineae bacterium]|nr:hypothetical protein [Anaerolineae bacterium]
MTTQFAKVLNTYDYSSSDHRQFRYWSPAQQYASGDQLARYLQTGWSLARTIEVEHIWFGEARFVTVYWVKLVRDGREIQMRVLGNPFIRGLLRDPDLGLTLVSRDRGSQVRFKVIGR